MKLVDFILGIIVGYKIVRGKPSKPIPPHLLN